MTTGVTATCSSGNVLDDLKDTTIKDKTLSLPRASVPTDDMPLPSFSMVVASALGTGELDGRTWRSVIGETANYFISFHGDKLDSLTAYQLIGQKMYVNYHCIKREGSKPWVGKLLKLLHLLKKQPNTIFKENISLSDIYLYQNT